MDTSELKQVKLPARRIMSIPQPSTWRRCSFRSWGPGYKSFLKAKWLDNWPKSRKQRAETALDAALEQRLLGFKIVFQPIDRIRALTGIARLSIWPHIPRRRVRVRVCAGWHTLSYQKAEGPRVSVTNGKSVTSHGQALHIEQNMQHSQLDRGSWASR